MSRIVQPLDRYSVLGVFGVVLLWLSLRSASLSLLLGGGVLLLTGWLVAPPVWAAAGSLTIVAIIIPSPSVVIGLLASAGATLLLAQSLRVPPNLSLATIAFGSALVLLGVPTLIALTWAVPLWLSTVTLAVVGAMLVYATHRYEKVRLGIVKEHE